MLRLTYRDSTQYDYSRQWGIGEWNWVGAPNGVRIVNQQFNMTLVYEDYYSSTDGYSAYWIRRTGADAIRFNRYVFENENFSTSSRQWIRVHELGHGLGIKDHCAPNYNRQAMYYCCAPTIYSNTHDWSDYDTLWPQ